MITLGLGEYAITDAEDECLETHALGSCVALIMYCPVTKCSAMAHIVLPKRHEIKGGFYKEGYFADDITLKFIDFYKKKKHCQLSKLKVALVGGSQAHYGNDRFHVGERNVSAIREILDAYHISYDTKETLGKFSRSVTFKVKSGLIEIRKHNMIL